MFVLLKAVAYYLDRFGLNYSNRGFVETGASATDINTVLPGKTLLIGISIICALLFFASARLRGWLLPGVALGLLVLAAVIIGGVVPAVYQRFVVKPNEVSKESAYIQRGIDATRYAYSLTGVQPVEIDPTKADPVAAAKDTGTLSNIRLLDPNVVGPTYEKVQQIRNYYGFPRTLDIDRYDLPGEPLQDYVVAAREVDVNGLAANQQNWINQHLTYTHGAGLVAAPASTLVGGRPDFDNGEKDVPPVGKLGLPDGNQDGSRIYFGEQAPPYSVVRTKQAEVDGPGSNSTDPAAQMTNNYAGKGGVPVSGVNKLLFALRFKDSNLLLSSAITGDSRILYYRQPRERVQKVAPWLRLDGDPYPTVVDGRVLWVLDGYTTTDKIPYSSLRTLGDVTADSQNTQTGANNARLAEDQVNYIRNSVKATVDAEDGTVRLYDVDTADPILKAWKGVFPGTVLDRSQMPAGLTEHLRYPEDLFKVQRDLLTRYHVTDPAAFYTGKDFWAVPADPTVKGSEPQPPYYVVSQLPGQTTPQFNLTTTYVPQAGRTNLAAFLSVSSGGTDSQDAASGYGAFTLLRLPDQSTVDGVPQAQQDFDSFPAYSQQKTLFSSGGSAVIPGNLLALPLASGILYVEPVYLTGNSATSFPQLRKVLTSYNGVIGYDDTLAGALEQSFTGTAPATPAPSTDGSGASPSASATPSPGVSPTATPSPGAALPTGVADLAGQLQAALARQQAAAAAGDYTTAAAAQAQVNALIAQLGRVAGPAPTSAAPGTPAASTTAPAASAPAPSSPGGSAPAVPVPTPSPSPSG